jgi:hypothetical protein
MSNRKMQYLKLFEAYITNPIYKYRLFEIEDICLELKDIGFSIRLEKYKIFADVFIHNIIIMKPFECPTNLGVFQEFEIYEIKEVVLRLLDYLGDNFKRYKYSNAYSFLFKESTDVNHLDFIGSITRFEITWEEELISVIA